MQRIASPRRQAGLGRRGRPDGPRVSVDVFVIDRLPEPTPSDSYKQCLSPPQIQCVRKVERQFVERYDGKDCLIVVYLDVGSVLLYTNI